MTSLKNKDNHKIKKVKPIFNGVIFDRESFLLSKIDGLSVANIGCVGTEGNVARFHKEIVSVSKDCIGIDINESIDDIKLNHRSLILEKMDISSCGVSELSKKYDVFLFGEVLEHIGSAKNALDYSHYNLVDKGEIIITVPNAFSFKNMLNNIIFGSEYVRTDHVSWYSYSTIKRLLKMSLFDITEFYFYTNKTTSGIFSFPKNIIKRLLFLIRPNLCEGIIIVAKKSSA